MDQVKVAKLKEVKVFHPRPYRTFYYGVRCAESEWSKIGRAASERGAVRAAIMKVYDRLYHSAVVHNEAGVVVARITRERNTIKIINVPRVHG